MSNLEQNINAAALSADVGNAVDPNYMATKMSSLINSLDDVEDVNNTPINTEDENIDESQDQDEQDPTDIPAKDNTNYDEIYKNLNLKDAPKEPESIIDKYLKKWEVSDLEQLKTSSPDLYDLLVEADAAQKKQYEAEVENHKVTQLPAVKQAIVIQQAQDIIAKNADNWAAEFVDEVVPPDIQKQVAKLSKTKIGEITKYVDELTSEYVLTRHLGKKNIYNPMIFYKAEILSKINTLLGATPNQPQPVKTQSPITNIQERQRVATQRPSGGLPPTHTPSPLQNIPKSLQNIIDLGL
jgi:hypothetical protein